MIGTAELSALIQPLMERTSANSSIYDIAALHVLEKLGLNRSKHIERHKERNKTKATRWIDSVSNDFLRKHPHAHGIEIDGGISTRFHRLSSQLDWPRFSWQLLNKPEITEYLHFIFPPMDNFRCVPCEQAELAWPDFLCWRSNQPVIVLAGESQTLSDESFCRFIDQCFQILEERNVSEALLVVQHSLAKDDLFRFLRRYNSMLRVADTYSPYGSARGDWAHKISCLWRSICRCAPAKKISAITFGSAEPGTRSNKK